MKHLTGRVAATVCTLSLLAAMLTPNSAYAQIPPARIQLVPVGSTAAIPHTALFSRTVPSRTLLHMDVALRPRDPSALASFVKAVSTPGSPEYRHFIAKGQFGSVFGPTKSQITQIRNTLSSEGLTLGATSKNGLIIPVTATAGKLTQSFHTKLSYYHLQSGRMAMANTSAPMLPASVAPVVQGIIGLNTIYMPKLAIAPVSGSSSYPAERDHLSKLPLLHQLLPSKSKLLPAHPAANLTAPRQQSSPQTSTAPAPCSTATSTAASYGAYTANQIASAYGLTSAYSNGHLGQGETIALYELAPFSSTDISAYQSCYGTTATVNTIKVDSGAPSGTGGSIEDTLDIEDAIGLAPQATIDVYEAPQSNTGPFDGYNQIATNDSAQVVSTSWLSCEPQTGQSYAQSEETIFEQMAAQGQSILAASGDTGSAGCYPNGNSPGFTAVSCTSSSLCWAGNLGGYGNTWNGSSWNSSLQVIPGMSTNGVGSISCPSTTFCMATGAGGSHYSTWAPSGGWTTPTSATLLSGKYQSVMSCASSSMCWLIDTNGNGIEWTGSSWSSKTTIDSAIGSVASTASAVVPSISCPSTKLCIVSYGVLTNSTTYQNTSVSWNGSTWSTPATLSDTTGAITALSCAPGTSGPCWAVDPLGNGIEWTSSGWASSTTSVDSGEYLSAVSCATATTCFAIGGNNNLYAIEWNGTSWQAPTATGVGLQGGTMFATSLSCPTATFCMGVTSGGSAIEWNGTQWGNFQQVDGISSLAVNDPASDPYVTGVGGTDMTSPGSSSTPPVETAWNEKMTSGGGGGGGMSTFWQMPSWQQGSSVPGIINSYSTGTLCNASSGSYCREVPDVSGSADPSHAYVIYYKGSWTAVGGTSAAAPTWASLAALAAEGYGATDDSSGKVTNGLGFLNPALYSIAASTPSAFNDITSGNNDYTGTNKGDYPAASSSQRYSMAAGLGSPNGSVLIGALVKYGSTTPAPTITSITPTSGSTAGGTSVTIAGTGFTSSATVMFGSVTATGKTVVNSSTSITAVSPAESAGTVVVTASVNGLTSSTTGSTANQFTYLPGDTYVPVTPFRICDTRPNNPSKLSGTALSQCEGKTLQANSSLTIQVAGLGSLPISATGAVLNVTAIMPTQSTYLTVYPSTDTTRPTASSLNDNTDTTVANLVEVQLPPTGKITIYNFAGQVNIAVDVEGYATASTSTATSLYQTLANPSRLVDTRCSEASFRAANATYCNAIPSQNSSLTSFTPGKTENIQVSGLGGVPSTGVTAVVLNVTSTGTETGGYFTLYPSGSQRPTASNVNWIPGNAVANRVVVPVSNGMVSLYSSTYAQAIVDVSGYFSDAATGNYLTPVSPVRICDTRPGNPSGLTGIDAQCNGDTLNPRSQLKIKVEGAGGLPSTGISAVIINLTAAGASVSGYLSVNPASIPPTTSDVNWTGAEKIAIPNLVIAAVNSSGYIIVYNGSGASTNVIVDVTGYMSG